MSFSLMGLAWDCRGITGTQKLVLLAICDLANEETGQAFPSQSYLAAKTCLSRKTICIALADLERLGLVTSTRTQDDTGRERNKIYRVDGNRLHQKSSREGVTEGYTGVSNVAGGCNGELHTGVTESYRGGVTEGYTDPLVEDPLVGSVGARDARPTRKAGSRLPDGWVPDLADAGYASGLGLAKGQIDRIALDFRDYWSSKAGNAGVKLDWSATWRVWVRREIDRGPPPPPPSATATVTGSVTPDDKFASRVARLKSLKFLHLLSPDEERTAIKRGLIDPPVEFSR